MSTEYRLYKKEKWEAEQRYRKYLDKIKAKIEDVFSDLSVPDNEDYEIVYGIENLKNDISIKVDCAEKEFESEPAVTIGNDVHWHLSPDTIREMIQKEGYVLVSEYNEVIDFEKLYQDILKNYN